MDTADLDIVYFVKEGFNNEELRYSLRSVDINMPHKRVWIFGGCPLNIVPDIRVRIPQRGKTKWDRVRNMYKMVCENKEVTDDFILFNDDFYIMKPTSYIEPLYRCTLEEHIKILEAGRRNPSEYSKLLRKVLGELGPRAVSFELHIPFVFNKRQLLQIMEDYPDMHCMRTMCGNLSEYGARKANDVKIFSSRPEFDYKKYRFLSTDDSVVNINNDVWRWIQKQFPKKSRWEI